MEFDIPLILIRTAWAGPLFTAPDIEQWPVIDASPHTQRKKLTILRSDEHMP